MSDYDQRLEDALRDLGSDPIDETGYYKEAFASLKGKGASLRITAWIAIMIFAGGLAYCLFMLMFHARETEELIKYGVWAIICNQVQIGMKLWFNMQLNRRSVTQEVRRLGLMLGR